MRDYLPNHLPFGRLALIALRDGQPVGGAFQPFSATQIIGSKRGSLSIVRLRHIEAGNKEGDQ